MQELFAEGLVTVALDEERSTEQRRRALGALAVLRPGGKGTWYRAVAKIHHPALAEHAREVARSGRK